MIYPIKHLPRDIPVGIQTETGVEAIGFDMKPWMDEFDGLKFSVWATRPGENAAYPAADVELVGTVLYWKPNGVDTAIAGNGKVEILAITGDKRKLSGWCETNVKATSLAVTQEVPEAARPWVDEVLDAADEAKRQADRAEKIANDMSGGVISGAVRYDEEQSLTDEEKAQARKNIGADVGVNFTTDETLSLSEDGVLSVNMADDVENDSNLPVTSAAVKAALDKIPNTGSSNVYVGADEPPEGAEVWINPETEISPDEIPGVKVEETEEGVVVTATSLDGVTKALVRHGKDAEGSTVDVDKTLTIENAAADAKAVGDKVTALSEDIEELKENGGTGGTGADAVVRELLEVVPKASKNLNTTKYDDRSASGVTFKVNPDNTIDLSGTPTANTSLLTGGTSANIPRGFTLQPGTYRLSGGVDGYVNLICLLYNGAGTLLSETVEIGYGKTISVTEECTCCVNIQARANKAMDGITVKAQLEAGTVTTEYVSPFSEDKRSKRLDDIEKHIDDIENSGSGLADELPDYWEKTSGYLTSKVETIRTLMRGCAEHGDVFYFLTDAHWHLNEKHSPAIIAWLNEHINVPRMINGGDITDEYDEEPSRLYRKAMGNGEYYFVDGNHEFLASKTYADNFYANKMFADKAVYGDENRTYYYVDNPAGKIRYIVLATFGPWVDGSESMVLNTTEQKEWLKNVALNVEDGWTVIVFAHIYSIENGRYIAGGETMLGYMADMTKGEVACVIQGDQHSDYILPSYADKIPIVCTTCDKNKNADVEDVDSRPSGTIKEQAFDVVILDKAQKQLHFVRIGYAKNGDEIRTVTYGAAAN